MPEVIEKPAVNVKIPTFEPLTPEEMPVKPSQNPHFESTNLLVFLYKWRKPLLWILTASVIVSTIVSFLITPKYKSTVILFPAVTNSISKALLSENNLVDQDILKFGEEEEAEQMLQILNSDQIRDRITAKYNLLDHYEIDKNDKYKMTKLYEEYDDNISFERTEFMSVRISVLDKNAQMAADIANDVSAFLDSTKNRMQKERAKAALRIVEDEYLSLQKEVKLIDDSLTQLRKLGINDYETQSEVFNDQYAIALTKGDSRAIKALAEKLNILAEYGGAYVHLRENLLLSLTRLNLVKSKYQEVKVDAEQNLTHKFVVNHAVKAEKRTYPIRWLIIVVSTITTLLLSVLLLTIFDNYKHISKTFSNL